MPFKIIAENCSGCAACERRCPTGAISGCKGGAFYVEPSFCIDCAACGVICPGGAIIDAFGNRTRVLKKAQRPVAVIHPGNCNGCGVCVNVCPFDAVHLSPTNGGPQFLGLAEVTGGRCVGCALCEDVCGWEGVSVMANEEKAEFLDSIGYAEELATGA